MKGATQCAKRLQQVFKSLRSKLGKPGRPPEGDAITQLILGVLTRDVPEAKAREALDRMKTAVVDYNELRVIPPHEIGEHLEDLPDARLKSEDISRALNRIFSVEHVVSLERVQALPRRDMLAYLEAIDGLEPYTRARVRLLGFNQPAAPLDEAMLAYVRQEEMVDSGAAHAEAQSFIERTLDGEELLEFFLLVRKQAWSEFAAKVRKGDVERIRSVPPDRTSRNMLRQIAMANAGVTEEPGAFDGGDEFGPLAEEPETEPEQTSSGKKRKSAERPARKSARAASEKKPRPKAAGKSRR